MKKIISLFNIIGSIFIGSTYAQVVPSTLAITSQSFDSQTALAKIYTCDGKDISPQLSWTGVPQNTQSLVLIFSDPDAPGGTFYHWVLYNLPPTVTSLSENIKKLPAGTVVGKNSWGKMEYNGPCPPKGSTHSYIFTLYALDSKLSLPAGADAKTVMDALQSHLIAKAEITTSYGRSSR